ncbi:MAG: thermonuclease family protein [Parvibaculum sp.]|nr:thermonuclease family protein [Parvibaculum sp.]
MFSTKDRIVRFERKPPPQRSNQFVFPTIVIGLAMSIFAIVIYWPVSSPTFLQTTEPTSQTYVSPILTTFDSTLQGAGAMFKCTVTTVYDGDGPIHCREGASIRLHAIAAREMNETCLPGHPCPPASGAAAKSQLQSLVLHHVLRCEQTGTSYNRVTAICWTESGIEVNCAMIRSGKAMIWESYDRNRHICS